MQADASAQSAQDLDHDEANLPTVADLFRCSKGLKVILLRMTRDPDLASDLTQDVLESVLGAIKAKRVKSAGALPAYVHACAKNMVIANARRASRIVLDNDVEAISADATPLDTYEKAELAALAGQVLAELNSERDRALIRGFYVDGQTKQALMLAWNLDKDHFDKVLSRARLRMRELMHEKLASRAGAVSGVTGLHLVSKQGAA